VLFLTKRWYNENKNTDCLERLRLLGFPILVGFSSNFSNIIDSVELNQVVHNFLEAKDLPILESYVKNKGYFYCKVLNNTKEVYYRDNGSELRVI